MIWIVLAALGVPIWLVVGGLAGTLWSRRNFRRALGVFACKVRSLSGSDGSGKWKRGTAYARWVHDVLLVHRGLALVRFEALPVRVVDQTIETIEGVKVKGGDEGEDAVSIRLSLDDGSVVEIASSAAAAPLLSGPFLAAWAMPVEDAAP